MTVEHPKYGTGTVVRREGEGEDAKITVNFPRLRSQEAGGKVRRIEKKRMNTKKITDKAERKKVKRARRARKRRPRPSAPPAWRAAPRRRRIRHQAQGQRKR